MNAALEQKRKAAIVIAELSQRLQKLEAAPREPIAIVGMSCRFPGAPNPEAFWRLLSEGRSAIKEVPSDRWDIDAYYDPDPDVPGKMTTRYGGFVDEIDHFDPQFFRLSPREAASMDPQHRLLLEVTWEALEDAGHAPSGLAGSKTGVFVGISTSDYAHLMQGRGEAAIDAYLGTGTAHCAGVGRVSHFLGLQGPNVAIDTACSSSLVAVSLACKSILSGECELAIAGGINAILAPDLMINFSKARMLAPDGRCKTFDNSADGYVRGEGCGLIILKSLSAAQRDGDRILALVRGSAINQDGASSSLTVPSGPAQQSVIRDALRQANLKPADVEYLEAHGTGTSLGDPIEVQAAASVLGERRDPDHPLLIGSVKTNIGHLESAAGIAGLFKVVLAMRHGVIPKQLHFRDPNRYIPWAELPVRVATEANLWPGTPGKHVAGVSSFGFSGTNAHVLLEAAPKPNSEPIPGTPERKHHVLAMSAKSDDALKQLAARYLAWLDEHSESNLADFIHTANTGRSHLEQRAALVVDSRDRLRTLLGALHSGGDEPGLHGGRARGRVRLAWLFTGRMSPQSGTAKQLYLTEPTFTAVIEQCDQISQKVRGRSLVQVLCEERELLANAEWAHPAQFAIQAGLAALWQSWGVQPDALLGHGWGQYAAAHVAGVFSLEDGFRLLLKDPAHPDPSVKYRPIKRTLLDNLTGQLIPPDRRLDGEYWTRQQSEPDRFARGIKVLQKGGYDLFLELGPQPVLAGTAPLPVISSLSRDTDDVHAMMSALAELYAHGLTPNFKAIDAPWPRRKLSLPTYPFQRQPYRLTSRPRSEGTQTHALLGRKLSLADGHDERFEQWVSPDSPEWLGDYSIEGQVELPPIALIEMLLAASGTGVLEDLHIEDSFRLDQRGCWLQTVVRQEPELPSVEVFARSEGTHQWRCVAGARIMPSSEAPHIDRDQIRCDCTESVNLDTLSRSASIRQAWVGEGGAVAELRSQESRGTSSMYCMQPDVLEAAFQILEMTAPGGRITRPTGIERVEWHGPNMDSVWCHCSWEDDGEVTLFAEDGRAILHLKGVSARRIGEPVPNPATFVGR